ncbi:MAG: diaminopimelate decarboxylase, partial [Halobacteria archaeon]|nr:diaminopimelate decarboxylase [Halobacteria archaeon]
HDRSLSKPEEGDLLAVHNAGAYGYVMASRYNSRPLPGEVLVDDAPELVREPEEFDDLFRNARFD